MAITHSVSATGVANKDTSNPTISITPVTGDSILILTVYIDDTTEGNISSVSDNQSNTWVNSAGWEASGQRVEIYHTFNPVVAATTITLNTTAACDTVLNAVTFQGTQTSGVLGNDNNGLGADSSNTVLSISTSSPFDAVVIYAVGARTDGSWGTYGTGQVEVSQAVNGGAEKFGATTTYEIESGTAAGTQTAVCSKSAAYICTGIEILVGAGAPAGFAHSQGVIIA